MSLQEKSQQLKELVSTYDAKWLLGDLRFLIHAGKLRANDQLGSLSSPMRQLTYLIGLNISTEETEYSKHHYDPETWAEIVVLLNEIEIEYEKVIVGTIDKKDFANWKHIRQVTIPSFFSYFNEGLLNFEEQILNWIIDLFSKYDYILQEELDLNTEHFISFYKNLSKLHQNNFQSFSSKPALLRANWEEYIFVESGIDERIPQFVRDKIPKAFEIQSKFMVERGIKDRFYASELVSDNLNIEQIEKILSIFSCGRETRPFLYYSEQNPGNPILTSTILKLDNGMFQSFSEHHLLYQIRNYLELKLLNSKASPKYSKSKGDLLENNIVNLFRQYLGDEAEIFNPYYVDGNEQDVLVLWEDTAFIIEAKAYNLREPLRNPEKAFPRIRDDFNSVIGDGYKQTSRIEKYFINGKPLIIQDSDGKDIKIIDTNNYKNDFSIIVNQNTFGFIQIDLSYLLELNDEDDVYPWATQFDDLEIFILTLIAKKKKPKHLIDFLLFREELHGKIISKDELEICGGFIENKFNVKAIKYQDTLETNISDSDVFDKQYHNGMGFKNEEYFEEKRKGNLVIW